MALMREANSFILSSCISFASLRRLTSADAESSLISCRTFSSSLLLLCLFCVFFFPLELPSTATPSSDSVFSNGIDEIVESGRIFGHLSSTLFMSSRKFQPSRSLPDLLLWSLTRLYFFVKFIHFVSVCVPVTYSTHKNTHYHPSCSRIDDDWAITACVLLR